MSALAYILANPLTSGAGAVFLMRGLGGLLTDLSAGVPIGAAVAAHASDVLSGVLGLAAKDANVTGGARRE